MECLYCGKPITCNDDKDTVDSKLCRWCVDERRALGFQNTEQAISFARKKKDEIQRIYGKKQV